MRSRPSTQGIAVVVLLAVALTLSFRGIALAQQSPLLISAQVPEIPTDPAAPAWQQAQALEVPLGPQPVALPRLLDVSVGSVSVRSLNDGKQIAFLLEWPDQTRNTHATRPDEFRDAAAVLLAAGDFLPNICMGSPGQLTNLWHWKADWQEDADKGFQEIPEAYPNFYKDYYSFVGGTPPYHVPDSFATPEARQFFIGQVAENPLSQVSRPSPIEEMVAAGFGTATHKPEQNVTGRGVWADGHWRVLFVRQLAAPDPGSANLAGKPQVPVAFAVWDGAHQEVGARKQLSALITARVEGQVAPLASPYVIGGVIVVALILIAAVGLLLLRRRATA